MKAIATCLFLFLMTTALYLSGLTPWRLVRQSELDALQQQIESLSSSRSSGSWRLDPNYRTALEKTRSAGTTLPESQHTRENSKGKSHISALENFLEK